METIDQTGLPIADSDFEEAIAAVTKTVVGPELLKLPPELAVQMANIRRCLQQGLVLTRAVGTRLRKMSDE